MQRAHEADRLSPLDALRGLAALAVAVFSHYVHFGGDRSSYPFDKLPPVHWLYANSWLMVDLFFLLSGIVLTYRYLEPLAKGQLRGREFLMLRVSRLYPLHVSMLLVCAAIEWTLLVLHKPLVIYDAADLYHFVLQLLYLNPIFGKSWAFNEPSWSVGAEVLAYLLFFVFASRWPRRYVPAAVGMVILGLAVQTNGNLLLLNGNLARGLTGFYVGSLCYLGMRELDRRGLGDAFGWVCLALFAVICTLANLIGYDAWIGPHPPVNCLAVFPPLIFAALRVKPLARLLSLRPLTFLGDISYSIYLVHVPVQMAILALSRAFGLKLLVTKPGWLLTYALIVVGAATVTRYAIEIPASRWIRQRYRGEQPAAQTESIVVPAA